MSKNIEVKSRVDLDEIDLGWLKEGIRNLVKQEVITAINQVDLKTIIQKAVDEATKKINVVHTEIVTKEVDHYEIKKKTIEVPQIKYRREDITVPVIREKIHWVEKIKELGDK